MDVVRAPGAPPLPTLTLDLASAVADGPLPEMDTFTVELRKDLHGLGITIAGYVCEKGTRFEFSKNSFLLKRRNIIYTYT